MYMKLKKTLAVILSLVTVFPAAFTSMAEVDVVGELSDQMVIVEEPVEAGSGILSTAVPEDVIPVEDVAEVTEGGAAEGGSSAYAAAKADPEGTGDEITSWAAN